MILLNERSNATYDHAIVQLDNFDQGVISMWEYYKSQIPEEALFREFPLVNGKDDPRESKGFENAPHVTVLYGLPMDVSFFEVTETVFNNLTDRRSFVVEDLDFFSSPDKPYDVAILRCNSELLGNLHFKLRERFNVVSDYPEYNPHITIAYVKKGWRPLQDRHTSKPYLSFDGVLSLSRSGNRKLPICTLSGCYV